MVIFSAVIGDYDAEPRSPGYVSEYKLLPKQTAKLEEKVAEEHKHFKLVFPLLLFEYINKKLLRCTWLSLFTKSAFVNAINPSFAAHTCWADSIGTR